MAGCELPQELNFPQIELPRIELPQEIILYMRLRKIRRFRASSALWFVALVAAFVTAEVVVYFASHGNQSRTTALSTTSNHIDRPWSSQGNGQNWLLHTAFPRPIIYPYSVVPGGIHSSEGLREAVARDHVVGLHYSHFNLARIRTARLKTAQSAYVSYRIGNKIYWTRRKLKLAKGEEVITDGVHYARTRCGNQISSTPKAPTSIQEPPPQRFESPLETVAEPPVFPYEPIPPAFIQSGSSVPSGFIPPIPIVILPPGGTNPPGPPPAPVVAVPEPSTWILLSVGLLAMYVALRKKIAK